MHHPGLFNAIQVQGSCQRGRGSLEAPQRNTKSAKRGTRGGRSTRRRRKVEGRGGGGGGGGRGSGVSPPPTGKCVPISAVLFLALHTLSRKYQWLLPKVSGINSKILKHLKHTLSSAGSLCSSISHLLFPELSTPLLPSFFSPPPQQPLRRAPPSLVTPPSTGACKAEAPVM
ncbi:unnamed protein product [Pleuronectes platessa]|uniref:Uncharacterized protein n=1 Tax=Pleuronectes platessa TaxID=8262 RepID=A0A9N7UHG0_PLEPL|nr:unnamed protein product [Pleuronectes platessa]